MALQARQSVFGSNSKNLYVATAHEDLAYASYVFNYASGFFQDARLVFKLILYFLNGKFPLQNENVSFNI